MSEQPAPTGVLLAAGRGSRAGGAKQFLPVVTSAGVLQLVCAAYDAVAWACASMIVVVGHQSAKVSQALGSRPAQLVEVDPDAPMAESVQAGLRAAIQAGTQAVLLHLGDHAWVQPATLKRLLAGLDAAPDRAIFPTFRGRGGHPALIPYGVAREVVSDDLHAGLREFWTRHANLCIRLPVTDPGVVRDVDRA